MGGVGLALAILVGLAKNSDIGRAGKKMVLRCIPIYFLPTIIHTGFLIHLLSAVRALIFVARRIQPFLSLVDREVESCIVVVFTLKAVPISTQYLLTSVPVQLTRTPFPWSQANYPERVQIVKKNKNK